MRYARAFPYTLLSPVSPILQSTLKTSCELATESRAWNILRILPGQLIGMRAASEQTLQQPSARVGQSVEWKISTGNCQRGQRGNTATTNVLPDGFLHGIADEGLDNLTV